MKEKLIKEANEIIEAMEYFKSFIERIPDDKLDTDPKFYTIKILLDLYQIL
jgi:hypothetical protein